jgi:molybdate transport system substrate-binding protein
MRRIPSAFALAALFLPLVGLNAGAAEIHVLAPTSLVFGLQAFAKSYTQETGTTVTFNFGNAGTIPGKLDSGVPADVVVLSAADMEAVDAKGALAAGSKTNLGRDEIGFIVKAGAPHPDISTPDKFRAALLAASLVIYNDPTSGSASGVIVGDIIKDPKLAGVKVMLLHNAFPVQIVTLTGTQTVLEPLSEIGTMPGFDVVGIIPATAHVDFSIAVPAKSTQADAGLAFLRYITRPEAAAGWKAAGLDR